MSRVHKRETELYATHTYSAQSESIEDSAGVESDIDVGHGASGFDNMPDDREMRALYLKNLCMFYVQLQAKYLIPSSTI